MLAARKFFIFFVTFFVAGVIQVHAQQESTCYVAVSVEDDDKAPSSGDEEIQGEAKINMKFQNGIQKNWNVIAKELGYRDIKEMIKVHKKNENWDNYKKYFIKTSCWLSKSWACSMEIPSIQRNRLFR